MAVKKDWAGAMRPLLRKYKGQKHPLEYHDVYQLLVMVVLSARSADVHINSIAPAFFEAFGDLHALSGAEAKDLFPYLRGVTNFAHKAQWLVNIARQLRADGKIPLDMERLTALPGIGRKSANVILREAGRPAEGIMVDLHTVRVATRLGITREKDPQKIEEKMMKILPRQEWDAGMAMSFLGREICRPKPLCEICPMKKVCAYYQKVVQDKLKKVKHVAKK